MLAAPLALLIALCAAFSAVNDPFRYIGLSPGVGYAVAAAPLVAAAFAVGVPLLAARAQWLHGRSPLAGAFSLDLFWLVAAWVGAVFLGKLVAKRRAVRA